MSGTLLAMERPESADAAPPGRSADELRRALEEDLQGPLPSSYADPNDWYLEKLSRGYSTLVAHGVAEEDAAAKMVTLLNDSIENVADLHAQSLRAEVDEGRAAHVEFQSGFRDRLRGHWGDALDTLQTIIETVEQGCDLFWGRSITEGEVPPLAQALSMLTGQAVRVSREVHALLEGGYPHGALSLCRTLHEIAVQAAILSRFGTMSEYSELGEKYLRHDAVLNYQDALIYERDAEALGHPPLGEATLARAKTSYDEALAAYGKAFRRRYGWASQLPGLPLEPSFEQLESAAELDHQRGYYKWASHQVHATPKGLRLGRFSRGGTSRQLSGQSNTGLADPGQQAARSLFRVFTFCAVSADPMSFYDQLLLASLNHLVDRADREFVAGEESVDAAEEALQAECAARGMRFDPVLGEVPLDEG